MESKSVFRRITTLFVLHTLVGLTLLGQSTTQMVDLPNVVPPSPNAAALGKFGDIPVGAYTGIPNIGIPLYTMQVGKYSLPISLDYHSGGLKVEEVSSSVGLGWALSAGGVITRSMHGQPDEGANGYFQQYGLTAAMIAADPTVTASFCGGTLDKQPDQFYFNFAGQSGKFILDTTAQRNARFIPYSNIKLTHAPGLDSFQIIDANGIIYVFSTAETTSVEGGRGSATYISSWYLTTIITPSGNINFTYATEQTSQLQISELDYLSVDATSAPFRPTTHGSSSTVVVDARRLIQIASPFETVTFASTPGRMDMSSASSVNGMVVTDPNGHTIKHFSFAQSYFGPPTTDPNKMRLKLDRVDEISVSDPTQKKSYSLQYYSPASVPSVQSHAKDFWGFYNGQNSNTTCLPYVDPAIWTVYVANQATPYGIRDPDAASSQVGVLQSIQYPTGGSSQFIYEGNDYGSAGDGLVVNRTDPHTCNAGVQYPSAQTHYSFTSNFTISTTQYTTLQAYGTRGGTLHDGNGPTALLNQINAGGSRTNINTLIVTNASQTVYPYLTPGNYELIAQIDSDGTTQQCTASLNYTAMDSSSLAHVLPTGGVRIKQIINTDSTGGNQNIKSFKYRFPDDSTKSSGSLLTAIQTLTKKISYTGGTSYLVRGSSPSNYLGSTQGSHVGYSIVTETEVSGNTTNGRKESYFSSPWNIHNQTSTESSIHYQNNLQAGGANPLYQIDNDVYRGMLQKELTYNASSILLHSTVNNYNISYPNFFSPGAFPANYYEAPVMVGYLDYLCIATCSTCTPPGPAICSTYDLNNYALVNYKIVCPWIYKINTINTTYDQNGLNPILDTINYYYDNPTHGEVTRILQNDSKGYSLKTVNIYPGDKSQITGLDPAAGTVLDSMVSRNMIAPVVQEEHYKNNNLVLRTRTDYAIWGGPLRNIAPSKKWYQIGNNAIENRINFMAYDYRDNLLQLGKVNDISISYIWDYLSSYPIAEVKNADSSSIAHTSFESNGTGNWTIGAGTLGTTGGITGTNFYTLSSGATISKSGLPSTRNYLVTYWAKNGPLTISGTTATSGLVKRGWTFYQHSLPAASTSVSINGAGVMLDELRLYPADAQMTTYTYAPLVGMTSSTNPASLITNYEYDGFNRLLRIRDIDSNILKQYDYQYQQPVLFFNVALSRTFTRNNCAAGGTPSTVTYTVAAGAYSSTLSQSDADAKAQTDATNNGQNYANANGTCTYYNTVHSQPFTRNNCATGGTPSSVTYTVAAGAYSSLVSQPDAEAKAQTDVINNGQNYANANGTCTFYNAAQSQPYTRNNCSTGGVGSSVTYSVAAGTYSSLTSQAAADQQALSNITTNGQNYANANGTCTYYNTVQSGSYTRNNCSCLYTGSAVTYTVAANTYSSVISQTAANQQAMNVVTTNGQAYANANGTCTTTCLNPANKISNCTCLVGTLGVVSQTQTGSGSTLQCTTQYGYFFSDGTYLLANRTVTAGQCLAP
ncbi:MAG TPA: DUF5977 domain-containing protein [Puia sp.]